MNYEKEIQLIPINRANVEYIAQNGKINGSLLIDISKLIDKQVQKAVGKIAHDNREKNKFISKLQQEKKELEQEVEKQKDKFKTFVKTTHNGIELQRIEAVQKVHKLQTQLKEVREYKQNFEEVIIKALIDPQTGLCYHTLEREIGKHNCAKIERYLETK